MCFYIWLYFRLYYNNCLTDSSACFGAQTWSDSGFSPGLMSIAGGQTSADPSFCNSNDSTVFGLYPFHSDVSGAASVSSDTLLEYIKSKRSLSTVRKTDANVSRFCRFLADTHNEYRVLEDIPPVTLDTYVGEWILSLKKASGSSYEPDSLTSFHRSIDRYLRDKGYGFSLVTSPEFSTSKQVLSAKRKELSSQGFGNKPNKAEPLTEKDEELLWESGELGLHSPRSLSNTVWYHCTKLFGFRGGDESRQLKWGDVSLKVDENNDEYLEFNERNTKTRQGNSAHSRPFTPKAFSNKSNTSRCPVAAYKLYAKHRPDKFKHPESPFYVAVNHSWSVNSDSCWFKNQPLGPKLLGRKMKDMAERAGIQGRKLVNHSVRKTMCSNLLQKNVPPTLIAQLSGHKNIQSLSNYAVASLDQQREMCQILQNVSSVDKCSASSCTSTCTNVSDSVCSSHQACTISRSFTSKTCPANHAFFAGATIQGGTFTINVQNVKDS